MGIRYSGPRETKANLSWWVAKGTSGVSLGRKSQVSGYHSNAANGPNSALPASGGFDGFQVHPQSPPNEAGLPGAPAQPELAHEGRVTELAQVVLSSAMTAFAGMDYSMKCKNCGFTCRVKIGGGMGFNQITGFCVETGKFVYLQWKRGEKKPEPMA